MTSIARFTITFYSPGADSEVESERQQLSHRDYNRWFKKQTTPISNLLFDFNRCLTFTGYLSTLPSVAGAIAAMQELVGAKGKLLMLQRLSQSNDDTGMTQEEFKKDSKSAIETLQRAYTALEISKSRGLTVEFPENDEPILVQQVAARILSEL